MQRKGWKHYLTEFWALVAVAIIAFVAGLLIGDLGGTTKTETVHVAAAAGEGEETEPAEAAEGAEREPEGESASGESSGGQLFATLGCGSCHTLAAAGTTGTTGPNLTESLAPDDNTQGIEVMIVEPNSEVVEGYPPNVMPQNYGQQLSREEVHQLAEYLAENTPAKP